MDVRWWILICCSVIGFTTDFYTEEPSTLVQRLTGTADTCFDGTDHCTNLSVQQFNLIFSTTAVSSAVGAIFAGFIIDRYGCKMALIASSVSMLVGAFLFVGSTYIVASRRSLFMVMEIGNIVGGIGDGAVDVINHRIKASWFMYKELALAFSVHILASRLGSATSYLLIGALVEKIGLQPCLWIGTFLIALASVACIVMAFFDERGAAMINTSPSNINTDMIWSFFKSLDGIFWCFTLMVPLSYGTVATFTANGPNFIARAYGYSESTASYLVGIVYDISLFALFFGWLTDRYGRRENWLLASSALLFVAFVLEASVPHFPAWLLTTIVGFGYTIFGPTFWSSIPLLVLPSYVGAALGFLKFCHYGGVAVLTAIAGAVLDSRIAKGQPPWQFLIVMLFCTTTIGLVFACLVIYLNARTGRRLSPSQQKRDQVNVLKEVTPLYTADERYSRYGSVLSHVQSPEKSSLDLTHALINK